MTRIGLALWLILTLPGGVALAQEKEKLIPAVISQLEILFGEDPAEYPENKKF